MLLSENYKKIIDLFVPEIKSDKLDYSGDYYIFNDYPLFFNQDKEKLLTSITKCKFKDEYIYTFSDNAENSDFNKYLTKRASLPEDSNQLKNNIDGKNKCIEDPKKKLQYSNIVKDISKLDERIKNFQNFSFSLMNCRKLSYIQQPWTPKTETDEDSDVNHTCKNLEYFPHYKLEYKIVGGDVTALLTELVLKKNVLDFIGISDDNLEYFYNDFSSLQFLKCENWIKFYNKLQKFLCDLDIKSKKLDSKVLYLQNVDQIPCLGYFEIVKHYYILNSTWRLSLIFIFHPEIQQVRQMSLFQYNKDIINLEKVKIKEKQAKNPTSQISNFFLVDKSWNSKQGEKILKKS